MDPIKGSQEVAFAGQKAEEAKHSGTGRSVLCRGDAWSTFPHPHPPVAEMMRIAAPFRFSLQTLPPIPIPAGGVVFGANKTAAHTPLY